MENDDCLITDPDCKANGKGRWSKTDGKDYPEEEEAIEEEIVIML